MGNSSETLPCLRLMPRSSNIDPMAWRFQSCIAVNRFEMPVAIKEYADSIPALASWIYDERAT